MLRQLREGVREDTGRERVEQRGERRWKGQRREKPGGEEQGRETGGRKRLEEKH